MENIDEETEVIELLQDWRDAAQQAIEETRQADLFDTSKYLAKMLQRNATVLAKLQHARN